MANTSAASAFHAEGRTTGRSGVQTEDAAQPHLSRESRLLGQRALVLLCNSRKSTAPTGAVARVSRGASRPAIDTHRDSQTHHRRRSVRAYVVDDLRPCTSTHHRRPPGRSGNRSFVRERARISRERSRGNTPRDQRASQRTKDKCTPHARVPEPRVGLPRAQRHSLKGARIRASPIRDCGAEECSTTICVPVGASTGDPGQEQLDYDRPRRAEPHPRRDSYVRALTRRVRSHAQRRRS